MDQNHVPMTSLSSFVIVYFNLLETRQKERTTLPCSCFIYEDGKLQQHCPTLNQFLTHFPWF